MPELVYMINCISVGRLSLSMLVHWQRSVGLNNRPAITKRMLVYVTLGADNHSNEFSSINT
jgi:hypothetical protein